jgi:EAL domain-containing protein (putative c-di-GMP-specific phosphodiesterase class I)/GGDEF domain-containing protein
MSLIRQIRLLLLATLLLSFLGSVGLTIQSARDTLETQLRLKNSDNASSLAMVLGQQSGEMELMKLVISAQFDTGFYQAIRFVRADGQPDFVLEAAPAPARAPAWFTRLLPIASQPGLAQVSDGWRALGSVQVVSQTAYAHDDLWRASVRSAAALAVLGLLVALVSQRVVQRIQVSLDRTVEQAQALVNGDFITVAEPKSPELQRLTRAMNTMIARLKSIFEAQAAQIETLRQHAYTDPVTGVSNRGHFMGQLSGARQSDYDSPDAGLILLRILNLAVVNRTLGRVETDKMIGVVSQVMKEHGVREPGCHVGRLNGTDFALYLPSGGRAQATADDIVAATRDGLAAFGPLTGVAIGAVEIDGEEALPQLLGAADAALARAENKGPFSVELVPRGDAVGVAGSLRGEASWRESLVDAVSCRRAHLVKFPVLDAGQQVIHLECPLRLQLDPDGPYETAARWLPLALRSRLTASIDELAVALALDDIAADGQPRCVNLSISSLQDSGFAARLRSVLKARPLLTTQVWLEVPELAAVEHFDLVQEVARQLRPLGVHFGLEHAGQRLGSIDRLFEAGFSYIKLDAAVIHGIDSDATRAAFLRSLVLMLHGLKLMVIAEGVSSEAESAVAWEAGVDGQTGQWTSTLRTDLLG